MRLNIEHFQVSLSTTRQRLHFADWVCHQNLFNICFVRFLKISPFFYFLVFMLLQSCSSTRGGDVLIYGRLLNRSCEDPVERAKLVLIDAIFRSDGELMSVLRMDSLLTESDGRFEFIYGDYEPLNEPGLIIETQNSTFWVKFPLNEFSIRHVNMEVCEI